MTAGVDRKTGRATGPSESCVTGGFLMTKEIDMTTTILTDEQIVQALNLAGVTDYADLPLSYDLEIARTIEQAVLQSEQVQAWKKDAERLRYILDRVCMIQAASYGCKFEILNLPPHFGDCEPDPVPPFLSAIDAAMEKQS